MKLLQKSAIKIKFYLHIFIENMKFEDYVEKRQSEEFWKFVCDNPSFWDIFKL